MKKLIDQSSNKDITLKAYFLMKTFYEQLFPLFCRLSELHTLKIY